MFITKKKHERIINHMIHREQELINKISELETLTNLETYEMVDHIVNKYCNNLTAQ